MNLESFSPEEKLLQLIRKRRPKKEVNEGAQRETSSAPPPKKPFFQLAHLLLRLRPIWRDLLRKKEKVAKERPPQPALSAEGSILIFRKANQVLTIGVGIFLSLYLFSFFWGKIQSEVEDKDMSILLQKEEFKETPSPPEEVSQKPYAYYAAELEKRNIFAPSLYTERQAPPEEKDEFEEILKNLTLLGIVSGKTPQAIIENKKEGKTHFVSQGDTIGLIRVEEILEDKVILNYRGERLDLVL